MAEEPEETYVIKYEIVIHATNCTINIQQTGKPDEDPPPPTDPEPPTP